MNSSGMKFITKLVYLSIVIIFAAKVIVGYTTFDIDTEVATLFFGEQRIELNPMIYKTADFIGSTLDTGLLIVLVTLMKLKAQKEAKAKTSQEAKNNLLLQASIITLGYTAELINRDGKMGKTEQQSKLNAIQELIPLMRKASQEIVNDENTIQDKITLKTQLKEQLQTLLDIAIKNNDSTMISQLNKSIKTITDEIGKLAALI